MSVSKEDLQKQISRHKLFADHVSRPKEIPVPQYLSLKKKAVKGALSVTKKVSPELAAIITIGQSTVQLQELSEEHSTKYGTSRRLMYIGATLIGKLIRPHLPNGPKQLANVALAMADCRKDTLKQNDMAVRNNKVLKSSLGFIGSAFGGMVGTYLMPSNPYSGYFLGSQAGELFFQSLPCAQLQPTPRGELPPVHTKYWGYGRDNDAQNILTPLRDQYQATQKQLEILAERMYGCLENYLMQTVLKDEAGIILSKAVFTQLALTYQEINNHHSQEVQKILKNPQKDDNERIQAFKIKLKDFLTETCHVELIGLLRFVREEVVNSEKSNARDVRDLQQAPAIEMRM